MTGLLFTTSKYYLTIFDLSVDKFNPIFLSNYSVWTDDVIKDGNYVYLSGSTMKILDISNPKTPALVGQVKGNYSTMYLAYDGSQFLYGVAWSSSGTMPSICTIYDVSDPYNPTVVNNFATGGEGSGIAYYNNTVYIAMFNDKMEAYDVTNPFLQLLFIAPPLLERCILMQLILL